MASSYTSLLGLVLPVQGELQGTWGDTVNNQLTSLLDTAIAGTTTISTDADVTLTDTDGAANQARQAIILWTANGTVTRNITAPAQSKSYVVINASAGTQSIVIRGVGPTTGVTILKNEQAVVAWNGSDFVKVSTFGGSPSFTNVTVTGTTTLSGLTASTALALNASKEVVSVTNTGTGNNVLATSPTLTTPNLGTPSAATLTNATGLPLTTGVTGTLPTTNGGTGLTSFTSGGVVYASSGSALTTGSALTFDGTNLGLGTTTATGFGRTFAIASGATSNRGILFKRSDTNADTGFLYSDDGNLYLGSNAGPVIFSASNSEQMRLTSTGLGIGTSSLVTKFTVQDTERFEVGGGSGYTYSQSVNAARSATVEHRSYGSFLTWGTGAAGSQAERMRLDSSGNLGIGTSSPGAKLDVNGGNANTEIRFNHADNVTGRTVTIRMASTQNPSYTQAGAYIQAIQGSGVDVYSLAFGTTQGSTSATERARITSGGDLLVGTTSSTYGGQLTVRGAGATVASFMNSNFVAATSGTQFNINVGATTGDTNFQMQVNTGGGLTYGNLVLQPSGGEVYIAGTTDQGAYNLQCNGTGVWGAGAYVNGSDERLKEDITTIDTALDVVSVLRPVTFRYKESHSKDQSIQPGFIAQELQAAMAGKDYVDGVVQAGPEYLNVAYQSLIPLLTKAIQEQQALIQALTARVAALEAA